MMFKQELIQHLQSQQEVPRVREFLVTDINDDYIAWLNDPVVVQYSNQRFIEHSYESCRAYFNNMQSSDNAFLAIVDPLLGHVGTMTVYINHHHATADIGILLGNKDAWGKGVATQAWCLVLEALKKIPYLRKITAGTLACNESMIRLALRSGMCADGQRHAQEIVDGVAVDILFFAYYCDENE